MRVIGLALVLATVGQAIDSARAGQPGSDATAATDVIVLHEGSQRARSVVLELREGPLTVAELNRRIPPRDLEWTRGIVWDVEALGWIAPTEALNTYALTDRGRRMLAVPQLR
jgi:hypothetical protein